MMLDEALNEEIFFFMYHLRMPDNVCLSFEPYRRKWLINRFIEQKRKESEEIERAKKKKH